MNTQDIIAMIDERIAKAQRAVDDANYTWDTNMLNMSKPVLNELKALRAQIIAASEER